MPGQRFITRPAGNVQPTLYQLSIRLPGDLLPYATYTFPISPAHLRYERPSLSNWFDTQGPPSTDGVTRVVDTYGLAPPLILIEGTTGWDYHMIDGGLITGLQSVQYLRSLLAVYAQLNQQQRETGVSTLYTLEFYDYFSGQFWAVEPIGPQILRQAADRPELTYYRFRWAASRAVDAPLLGVADALLGVFATPAAAATINGAQTVAGMLAVYTPVGSLL
jgi:hypothetical protein